jgi:hypothetical protein
MTQKSITFVSILILSVVVLVAAITPLAYAQTIPSPPNENITEQNIVCSGWSYTCG